MTNADGKYLGIRVGVTNGGCAGMSYTMDFIDAAEIQPDDERYEYGQEWLDVVRTIWREPEPVDQGLRRRVRTHGCQDRAFSASRRPSA